jgi:hypothetical protein
MTNEGIDALAAALQVLESYGLLEDLKELRVGNISFSLFHSKTHLLNVASELNGINISPTEPAEAAEEDEDDEEKRFLDTLLHSSRHS